VSAVPPRRWRPHPRRGDELAAGGRGGGLDVEVGVERARRARVADLAGAVEVGRVDDDVERAEAVRDVLRQLEGALVVERPGGREPVDGEGAVGEVSPSVVSETAMPP
jgi:hypothetical protein